MLREQNSSIMSIINYAWQTFSLLIPIYMMIYTIMQSAIDMNIEGVVIFSIVLFTILVNELLVSFGILYSVAPTGRTSTCGILNYNKNFFMMNSTIILSFMLGFNGLNMYFNKNLNLPFLILLSFFLFMDIIYYVLICSNNANILLQLTLSIAYGGAFGLAWSYFHPLIFEKSKKSKRKKTSTYTVYNNGQPVASGTA